MVTCSIERLMVGVGFGALVAHAVDKATTHHFLDTHSLCRDDSCFPGSVEGLCFTGNNDFVLWLSFHVDVRLNHPFAAQPQASHSHPQQGSTPHNTTPRPNANSSELIK
ncbi:hypothetical protein ACSQ67_026245 [Phaseolus vulgaris]